jgi:hypothetical protein
MSSSYNKYELNLLFEKFLVYLKALVEKYIFQIQQKKKN